MNIGEVPPRCMDCPLISPYIDDIRNLESRQISSEMRNRLIDKYGFTPEDVDISDADNITDLEESKNALSEAVTRTIGCAGVRIIRLDSSDQSSAGLEFICQSPFEI